MGVSILPCSVCIVPALALVWEQELRRSNFIDMQKYIYVTLLICPLQLCSLTTFANQKGCLEFVLRNIWRVLVITGFLVGVVFNVGANGFVFGPISIDGLQKNKFN